MKKILIFSFILFYILPTYAISSYTANYDLYGQTDLGNIKFGSAEYELVSSNNAYIFRSSAKTDNLWKALYDYSMNETSIGIIKNNKLIGDYYKITESKGDSINDNYEINIFPNKGYVSLNNEIISNGFTKSALVKLSDSELIIKALESGNMDKIVFSGINALDNETPSYDKGLANRIELIDALLEPKLIVDTIAIVDALSIYLHISEDVKKFPNKKVFIYHLVDKKGLVKREFIVTGHEIVKINNIEIETIKIECPELRLTFNISEEHNFMPVSINKINGKTSFRLILTNYMTI